MIWSFDRWLVIFVKSIEKTTQICILVSDHFLFCLGCTWTNGMSPLVVRDVSSVIEIDIQGILRVLKWIEDVALVKGIVQVTFIGISSTCSLKNVMVSDDWLGISSILVLRWRVVVWTSLLCYPGILLKLVWMTSPLVLLSIGCSLTTIVNDLPLVLS